MRGQGFLHMCITNIGQKHLSTNEGFHRVTFTKAQVSGAGRGRAGGRMNGREGEEGQKGGGVNSQHGAASFHPQCTDRKECVVCFLLCVLKRNVSGAGPTSASVRPRALTRGSIPERNRRPLRADWLQLSLPWQ